MQKEIIRVGGMTQIQSQGQLQRVRRVKGSTAVCGAMKNSGKVPKTFSLIKTMLNTTPMTTITRVATTTKSIITANTITKMVSRNTEY